MRLGILDRLATGSLLPGDRLPAIRVLATELGLSAGTVARAYKELEEAGAAVVFRPERTMIRSYERRVDRLAEAYVLGREQARREVDTWLEFCGL